MGSGNPPAVHTQSTQWGVEKYGHCYPLSLFHFAGGEWAVGSGRSMDVALVFILSFLDNSLYFFHPLASYSSATFLYQNPGA